MKKSVVILNCGLFSNEIKKMGVQHFNLYANYSFFPFWLGKICRKLHLKKDANINPELRSLNVDCIIVFDSGVSDNCILSWLAKTYSDKRLIFYYWNPVFTSIKPSKIPSKFEKWSYSPSDCNQYNMKYNSTFYFESFVKAPVPLKRDVFFIGKNKGREKYLNEIKTFFESSGISSLFYLTANHPRLKQKKYMKHIPYKDVLNYVNESNAILDYYVDPHAGLSLRVMESIFFGKKLITNNRTITNYDFYNEKNVFLLDNNEKKDLSLFVTEPAVPIELSIKNRYLFEMWIERFI